MIIPHGGKVTINIPIKVTDEHGNPVPIQNMSFKDISAETYGKYQHCTMGPDGLFYADSDFTGGAGFGRVKRGALPAPNQDTPEKTAQAMAMHEAAAQRLVHSIGTKPKVITTRETLAIIASSIFAVLMIGWALWSLRG